MNTKNTQLYEVKLNRIVEQTTKVRLPKSINAGEVEALIRKAIENDNLNRHNFKTVAELEVDANSLVVYQIDNKLSAMEVIDIGIE